MTDYRGAIGGTNMNALSLDGTYVVTSAMSNAPAGGPVGALVHVQNFGNFVVQTYRSLSDPLLAWQRIIRPSAGTYGAWAQLGGAAGSAQPLPFTGKRIVCFGDSITENGDYPSNLAARTGATVVNGGFGGCRMAVHDNSLGAYYDPFSMYRLSRYMRDGTWATLTAAADTLFAFNGDDNRAPAATLAATDWSKVDYAVIFYGTNDFTGDVPVGAGIDATGATFKGAINVTVKNIMASFPHIRLMFVTPMWRTVAETPNANGNLLSDFADAIIERAGAYNIEVFDMYRKGGINSLNHTTYLKDGTHPTDVFGSQHIADKIGSALAAKF